MPARNTIEIRINAEDHASRILGGIGNSLQDLGKAATIGLAAITGAAVAAGAGLLDLAVNAASMGGIREAFEGMAEAAGHNADEMLRALDRGAAGMIDMETLMLKFNLATQLVGDSLAGQLPQALEYLSKVSSATGEDMGFLMDSLVRGVGRLSPMILDNLGIQVDLNAAYETYAASIGKTTDSLTKQEQQTALMNAVMEALAANTAAMPDIYDQTDTRLARLQATMRNFQLQVGDRLQPVLDQLVTWGEAFVGILNILILRDFTGGIFGLTEDSPAIAALFALHDAIRMFIDGATIMDTFWRVGFNVIYFLEEAGLVSEDFSSAIRNLIVDVYNFLKPIETWIQENIKLEDILIALGIAIGSVVIPAIIGIITAAAPIIALFAGLVLAVAAVRQAWETDFLGIRTFIEGTLLPVIQALIDMFVTGDFSRLPQILQQLFDGISNLFWENLARPIGEALSTITPDQFTMIAVGVGVIAGAFIIANLPMLIGAITAGLAALMATGLLPLLPIIGVVVGILHLWNTNTLGVRDRINELGVTLRNAWTTLQQTGFILQHHLGLAAQWVRARFEELMVTIQRIPQEVARIAGEVINSPLFSLIPNAELIRQQYNAALAAPRAAGGPVTGGSPYIVGERGPELFVPSGSGNIIPNNQMGGGGTFNIYFQGQGGPRDEQEANDDGYLIANALRAQGVEI